MKNEIALEYLYIPAKLKTASKAPVLVVMHGVGSNEQDLARFAETLDPRFAVMSLRGPLTMGAGSYGWFHVKFTAQGPDHNREEAEASRLLVKKFIEGLVDHPDVDAKKVYLLGFSQGTIMSLSLALTEPILIRGVVAIAGRTLQEISAQAGQHEILVKPDILLIHGVEDTKLPLYHAQETANTLTKARYNFEFKKYHAGHEITADMKNDIQSWLAKR